MYGNGLVECCAGSGNSLLLFRPKALRAVCQCSCCCHRTCLHPLTMGWGCGGGCAVTVVVSWCVVPLPTVGTLQVYVINIWLYCSAPNRSILQCACILQPKLCHFARLPGHADSALWVVPKEQRTHQEINALGPCHTIQESAAIIRHAPEHCGK